MIELFVFSNRLRYYDNAQKRIDQNAAVRDKMIHY